MSNDPKKPKETEKPKPENEALGEGNRSADRRYREGLHEFQKHDDPELRAREALAALQRDPEGFRRAEGDGKKPGAGDDSVK